MALASKAIISVTLIAAFLSSTTLIAGEAIHTRDDFVEFVNKVNSGNTYEGETVFLENDIDLSTVIGPLEPIGSSSNERCFRGLFNGKGHRISNLKINGTTTHFTGFFGYTDGTEIMNVIIDDTCLFSNSYSTEKDTISRIGGIGAHFVANHRDIKVKNCVVAAGLTTASSSQAIYIGGIVGDAQQGSYKVEIKNCAYVGTVENFGVPTNVVFGGIVGNSVRTVIRNSLFAGSFTHTAEGLTSDVTIGGIIGFEEKGRTENAIVVDNCVVIENFTVKNDYKYGHIIGNSNYYYIEGPNFWNGHQTSDSNDGYRFDESLTTSEKLILDGYTGNNVVDALNAYRRKHPQLELSQWIANKDAFNITFHVNNEELMYTDLFIVLAPSLANNPMHLFDGWYAGEDTKTAFDGVELTDNTDVFASYSSYTGTEMFAVSFCSDGEVINTAELTYGSKVNFPTDITKERHTFAGWAYEDGTAVETPFIMPAYNVTLHAQWAVYKIESAEEFKSFISFVNEGKFDYKDMTVSLERDIVFPADELQAPVGSANPFFGSFDGKGYVISNFKVEENRSTVAALFGTVHGGSVKNVVMDGSCSIKSTVKPSSAINVYVGSIIGVAEPNLQINLIVEDCVSMGPVEYNSESSNAAVFVGGIVGGVHAENFAATVARCANYGSISITTEGAVDKVYVGGIIGYTAGTKTSNIVSCLNNGQVKDATSTTTNGKAVGGIVGYNDAMGILGCVSYGQISSTEGSAIAGYTKNGLTANNNFYYTEVGCDDKTGAKSFNNDFEELVKQLNRLNNSDCGKWSFVTFVFNGGEFFESTDSGNRRRREERSSNVAYIAIRSCLPPTVASGKRFAGWFKDESLSEGPVNEAELDDKMTLYAGYGYKVTYDTNGTSTEDRTQALFEENETINYYPSPLNICHIINKWEPTNGNLTVRSEGGSGGNSENAYYIMPAHDVTLKATWSVKIFTITFNDTDLEPVQVECNTKFYPDNYSPPERPGYIFSGWSTETEGIGGTGVSIFSNYTLTPKWVPITDSQNGSNNSKKSNVGVIVGVTVSILVVIIIAIVIVLLFLMKHSNEDDDDESGYVDDRRDGDLELDERGDSCTYEWVVPAGQDASSEELTKSLNSRSDIYSNRYRAPTLKAALMKAGLGEKRAMKVADTCYEKAEGITDLPEGLTKDDAAALAMYTFDFGVKHYESNPFRLINKDLVTRSKESLKRIRGLLYLVMSALRKLPRVTGRTLYRGVRKDANIDQKHYAEGSVITWSAFSSTSPDMNTTKAFLAKGSEDGKAAGTLFIIEKGWGYSMQPYSLFPNEEEILMEPERKFKVTSVINAELIIITLEMIDSPLVLPQVFGNPADEGR